MRYPASFLDDIRERLPISDVVGSRVTWDRKKTNPAKGDYWACCPFHGEKTPSFHCENRKGRYHCFGCGVSGDHFRFLTELEGLAFPEAVERLASQAGLAIPVLDRVTREREEQRTTLFDVMEMAAGFFRNKLNDRTGAAARAYLRDRGIAPNIQVEFGLGYAPDSRNALKNHLAEKGVSKEHIEACGLVVFGPDTAVSYDRFRDRLIFPIPDSRGRVIAFGGRALRSDVPAKYLNSPETDLFSKSNVLFNFKRAREAARDAGTVIVAEGYMDVIALYQAGLRHCVAPMGTALTEFQLGLLWRLSQVPVLCFDGDEAGANAASRAANMALGGLRAGHSVRIAMLPSGKDPDDITREDGPSAMRSLVDEAMPLADFLWTRETTSGLFDTPEKRAELEARFRQLSALVGDESVRRHYKQEFSDRLAALFGGGNGARRGDRSQMRRTWGAASGNSARGRTYGKVQASRSLLNSGLVRRTAATVPMREAALLAGIVHHPAILQGLFEEFAAIPLANRDSRKLHAAILDIAAHDGDLERDITPQSLAEKVCESGLGELLARIDEQLRVNGVWQAIPDAGFEDALDGWRQAYALHMRMHLLNTELKQAEVALATEESEANFERLVQVHNELAREEGTEALIEGFGISSGRLSRNF
jgi:DNA primase